MVSRQRVRRPPGLDDADVLQLACREERILVTTDKDFGARLFEKGEPHRGVILLRLADERPPAALKVLSRVLEQFDKGVCGRFIVATERRIRPNAGAQESDD